MAKRPKSKHPNKEIRAAVEYAEAKGWRVEASKGHAWGRIYCPNNDENCRCGEFCIMSIWSTPKSPQNFAKGVVRKVDACIYLTTNNVQDGKQDERE